MSRLNLIPDTAASYAATYWVIAQPGISRRDQTGNTALITPHAVNVELRGDQFLSEEVGLILASAMAHDCYSLGLSIGDTANHHCLHAP